MLFLHVVSLLAAVAAPPSAEQYYAHALSIMESLPQPAYETYDVTIALQSGGVALSCDKNEIKIAMGWDKTMVPKLTVAGEYAVRHDAGLVHLPDGTICPTKESIFKPQWAGVHDWMRYGIDGQPQAEVKAPVQSDSPGIRTIATVTAAAPGAYDIVENGAATCPNGAPGHALHLTARRDPEEHPLTDVVVDIQTMRFCSMRFNVDGHASMPGMTLKGGITLDFGTQERYWAITGGHWEGRLRELGISVGRLAVDVTYSNVRYPAAH